MGKLDDLKAVTNLNEFASLLNVKPKQLSYVLYILDDDYKYTAFTISKKFGGSREISAPTPMLLSIQKRLNEYLSDCYVEIYGKTHPSKSLSHAFKKKHSYITNASIHVKKRYVLNLDLSNFFGEINFGRVRGYFLKDNRFELNEKVATIIAQIACFNGSLPQGSPSSPIISDFVATILDKRLIKIAKDNRCHYTRYADDLTFSTNERNIPADLVKDTKSLCLGDRLLNTIKRSGFEVNDKKTRLQYKNSRQDVTGIVVNKKLNVKREYYKRVRAKAHRLFNSGAVSVSNYDKSNKNPIEQLQGQLSYIYHIKKTSNKGETSSVDSLLKDFYLFLKFFFNKKPLIVCEGVTDDKYLRPAINSLVMQGKHKKLVTPAGKLSIDFYNYNSFLGRAISTHGVNGIKDYIESFCKLYNLDDQGFNKFSKFKEYFKFMSSSSLLKLKEKPPILFLLDNDTEAVGVMKKFKISPTDTKLIFHITENIYVAFIPKVQITKNGVVEDKINTAIEDYFDDKLLKTEIDGKKFDPDKKHGDYSKYGKFIFTQKVIKPNQHKIDFSNFSKILDLIEDIL